MTDVERLARLAEELDQLRRSLPAHSVKPAQLIRIEELEEEIASLQHEEKASPP